MARVSRRTNKITPVQSAEAIKIWNTALYGSFRYGNERSQGQRKSGNADGTPVKLYPRKGAVSSDRLLSYSDPQSLSQNEKDEQPKLFILPARLLLFLIIHPYEKEAKRRLFCVQ